MYFLLQLICLHYAHPSLYGLDQLPNRTRTTYNEQWGLQDLNKSRIDTHNLFTLLPSRRRYRARTSKQADICSFFPKAVTLLNTLSLYSNIQHSCSCIIHILYSCFIIYWLLSTVPWSTFLVKKAGRPDLRCLWVGHLLYKLFMWTRIQIDIKNKCTGMSCLVKTLLSFPDTPAT